MNQYSIDPSTEAARHEYLVEMTFSPFASVPSPQEVRAFTDRFVLPTLEACQRLRESGQIPAGGTRLGAVGFTFIARTASPAELEALLGTLPLWTRAETRITPLGSFAARAATVRHRLAQLPVVPETAAAASATP